VCSDIYIGENQRKYIPVQYLDFAKAFDKHNVEKDVAEAIQKEFDRKHGPTWHCIVGKNFGNKYW